MHWSRPRLGPAAGPGGDGTAEEGSERRKQAKRPEPAQVRGNPCVCERSPAASIGAAHAACVRPVDGPAAAVWGINQSNRLRPIEQEKKEKKNAGWCVRDKIDRLGSQLARGAVRRRPGVAARREAAMSLGRCLCPAALLWRHRSRLKSERAESQAVSCLLNLLPTPLLTTGYQSIDRFDAPPGSQFN